MRDEEDTDADKDIMCEEEGDHLAVTLDLHNVLSLPVDEMANAARDGVGRLNQRRWDLLTMKQSTSRSLNDGLHIHGSQRQIMM